MKRMRILILPLLAVVFLPLTYADESEFGGPPEPQEIIGFWKMVPLDKPEINKVNPWPMPYQWFAFYPDGHLVSMGKTEDTDYSRKDLEVLFSMIKEKAPIYHWQDNFLIVQYPDLPGEYEVWGMNIFRKDTRISKKGDLIMSLAGGKNMEPVYYRLLRPLK